MFFRVSSAVSIGRRWVAVTVLFFAAACSQPTVAPPENPSSGEWRTFEGTWSASGTRQTLELETNQDRKSTRLNSSHGYISYAVFCLKKKKKTQRDRLGQRTCEP